MLRTDLQIVQLPSTLPDFGGLLGRNKTYTDPDFGTKIVRATDASDMNSKSMQTSDTGASLMWNFNDTLFVARSSGGASFLYQFDPKTMKVTNLNVKIKSDVCFSRKNPGVMFLFTDRHLLEKATYKKINGTWTFQNKVTLVDFTKALPIGFVINWTGTFLTGADDKTFQMGFSEGVQNSGHLAIVWRMGKGFRILDTQAGVVTGDWGAKGPVTITSTVSKFPFTLHESSMTPNPNIAAIGGAFGNGHLYWDINTLALIDAEVSGHAAKGYTHLFAGGPGGGQIAIVEYLNAASKKLLVPKDLLPANQTPPQVYDGDAHYSMAPLKLDDVSMFWVTSQFNGGAFTSAWMNEVRGYNTVTGVVSRICHTFNSGQSLEFIVAHAIGCASQTGKFVAFTSDMMGTLGGNTGAAQGTLGVDARGDVFIVKVA